MAPDFQILGDLPKRNPKDQYFLVSPAVLPLVYQSTCKSVLMGAFLNPLTSVRSMISEFWLYTENQVPICKLELAE